MKHIASVLLGGLLVCGANAHAALQAQPLPRSELSVTPTAPPGLETAPVFRSALLATPLPRSSIQPAAPPTIAPGFMVTETPRGTVIDVESDVLFDFDRSDIKPQANSVLARVASVIRQRRARSIAVEGHTDAIGTPQYNMALGERRADAVRDWLVHTGFPLTLFHVASFGATHPVAPNVRPDGSDNPDGRRLNRRVEIILAR